MNTDFTGSYQTVYQVTDSGGLTAEKQVSVVVTENENLDQYIRYIDPDTYPNNTKALNWKKHLEQLKKECSRNEPILSFEIN